MTTKKYPTGKGCNEMTSKEQATELWDRLRSSFLDQHKILIEIIGMRAWEPLGYDSFVAAWRDQMKDITLASELRPHVVLQMIQEGLTSDEIAEMVRGVSPEGVQDIKEQSDNGVPAKLVRRRRGKPEALPYSTLFLHFPTRRMLAWRKVAKKLNTSVEQIALAAIEDAFKAME